MWCKQAFSKILMAQVNLTSNIFITPLFGCLKLDEIFPVPHIKQV